MLNVLTIDFDIIMTPSIQLYNDIAGTATWEELNKNPQLALCQADLNCYKQLTGLLLKIIPKIDINNLYFVKEHDKIVSALSKYNDKFNIINIDHHHDCGYICNFTPKTKEEVLLNCGNWVKYLTDQNQVNNYTWYRNINSARPNIDTEKYVNYTHLFSELKIETFNVPDIVVFCLSPDYIPYNYRELFFSWMDLCNFLHNTRFDFLP